MKPAPFDYHRAESVEQALSLLAELEDAKPLAGGQSLMPLLNMRLAQPPALIDLAGIPALSYVRRDNGHLAIGAMTTLRTLERDELVADVAPVIAEVMGHVGHVTIRNRGTVGGSVAHADPSAELPLLTIALDGSMIIQGPGGRRKVTAGDFLQGYLTTAIEPGELLVEVRLPVPAATCGFAFSELSRRHGDFALASSLASVELDATGGVRSARVVVGGASPVPVSVTVTEELGGSPPSPSAIVAAAARVRAAVAPVADVHADREYRRHIAGVLVQRTLAMAIQRAAEHER